MTDRPEHPELHADFWQQRYSQGQTGWDRGSVSPALETWATRGELPEAGAHFLVPGCGRGHEVVWLAARGYRVTAVDIAAAPLETLRAQLDGAGVEARLVHADLLAWQPETAFDALYEQTCLCAIAPTRRSEYAERLARWLRPGGSLFALFMQTDAPGGPPFDCPVAQMRELFTAPRWTWEADGFEVPHPTGLVERAFHLRRV